MERYEKIGFLGVGQFAVVYKARDVETDKIVAVKILKTLTKLEAQNGIHLSTLREIKILQELKHDNVIGLLDVFIRGSQVSLVFEFMDTDLETIAEDRTLILTIADIKSYMIQILQGLEYLHLEFILHRDLKPSNLLVNANGLLKIADFGLAKQYGSPNCIYTDQVVTLWYRAPELLLGAKQYGVNIDMWAVGCILAELLLRVPLFRGETDIDQLKKIFQILGTPTEENWPGAKSLANYLLFKPLPVVPLRNIFTAAADDLLDVVSKLFVFNPLKRVECSQCLKMPFFSNRPAPTVGSKLPLPQYIRDRLKKKPLTQVPLA